jgi:hypothetical protein
MNGKEEQSKSELNEVEYDILNAVYFVEHFDNIVAECKADRNVVADTLKSMIHKRWITPMKFDEKTKEYIGTHMYDSDNMGDYHYVATRLGLNVHNSSST